MPASSARAGGRDQVEVLLARRTDDDAERGVGDPAVDAGGEVDAEQVAVLERVVVGESVQDRVVDRRAEHLAERRGAERRVVVDVAGLRALVADHLVRERVELEQVDADVGGLAASAVSTSATKRPAGRICSIWAGVRSSIMDRPYRRVRKVGDMDLVLGTMYFGTRTDEATSFALLDRFVEAGGRVLDTANCYSFWTSPDRPRRSERGAARSLAGRPTPACATSWSWRPRSASSRPTTAGSRGCRRRVIEREAARSLERLGVDTIDVYWAHGEDRSTRARGDGRGVRCAGRRAASCAALGRLQPPDLAGRAGPVIAARLGVEPYTALQLTTSYVEPRPGAPVPGKDHRFGFVSDETVDYLDAHPEMDLWVYSPLVQGSFDRADRPFPEAYDHPGTTDTAGRAQHPGARPRGYPASQAGAGVAGRAWLEADRRGQLGRAARLRARLRPARR